MNKYEIACIGDLHFRAFSPKDLYFELQEGFIKTLKNMDKLDVIVILGDVYNAESGLNNLDTVYSFKFINDVKEIAINKKTKVRMIQGTRSHDQDQLFALAQLFYNSGVDFKLITEVQDEMLFDDIRVLYIPEEYIENPGEYYRPWLKPGQVYDFIFMHGLVDDASFVAKNQESESTHKKAPIFHTEDLIDHTMGCIMSGHIHTRMCIKELFYYVGSYSCWKHGEEEDKGFYLIEYDTNTRRAETKFVINKNRKRFITISIEKDNELFSKDIVEAINYLLDLTKKFTYDNLRFKIYIPNEYNNTLLLTQSIKEAFSRQKNIKIEFKNNRDKLIEEEMKEKLSKVKDKYGYIFDNHLTPFDKISMFIKERFKIEISEDEVRRILTRSFK